MKGDPKVIEYLNKGLRSELTAVSQYWLHYRLQADWGVGKLAAKSRAESIEEMHHADKFIDRILFLEGTPDMTPEAMHPGHTVPEMLRADLALEYKVREALAKGITLAEQHGDYQTREILELQLMDTEEDHAYWLEQQLGMIDRIGLQNYLQSQAS